MVKKSAGLIILMVFICAFLGVKFWAQQPECVESLENFSDSFGSTEWKDEDNSSVYWPGNGEITLNKLGGNFEIATPNGMGARIYVSDSGDFDGDGLPDLIGLQIFENDPYANRLLLIRNYYEDLDGDGYDDDGDIMVTDFTEVYEDGLACGPASITVADYNGDGLLDFFFMKNKEDEFAHTEFLAEMFINMGTATNPNFVPFQASPNLDFTSRFMSEGIYINWAGDHLTSVDIDHDMDMDILVISEDKIFLVRNPGSSNFALDQFEISEINYDLPTGFTVGRGGSALGAADFDNDGDIDIVGGTVNDINYLVYYENDGLESFTRYEIPIPIPECTGTVAISAEDFNNDGFIDIFAATDLWNAGNEARMWFLSSTGNFPGGPPDMEFRCLADCAPILPEPHDVDMSARLDYDQDGDYDVILADANDSGDYYLIINKLADVYALHGLACSVNITPHLDPKNQAITRVRLMDLDMNVRGGSSEGLAIELYVSNDNGKNWEALATYAGDQIVNLTGAEDWHNFTHFGSKLKWKAVLTAIEDEMVEYAGASYETPVIEYIELRYAVVDRREYSRTSVAAKIMDVNGEPMELIIGGSFYYPGWQGHLRAYDVTNVTAIENSDSMLRTLTRSDLGDDTTGRELTAEGIEIKWDAGQILTEREPSTRLIYTAMPLAEGGFERMDFTIDHVDVLKWELNDPQNDTVGLIQFVRGEGRDWLLGDINHSNPIIVGPPKGQEALMGSGFDEFKEDWEDRPHVIIVGANDGMLHCFDISTGEELWAFIPYNQLPNLRNMWPVEEATLTRYYARDSFVDGSPTAKNVFINDEWRTVVICGQGPTQGRAQGLGATGNYYFALDITNIEDPQPLWNFTDSVMGETWSTPVVGKIMKNGNETWAVFVGSGYDNVMNSQTEGNRFYAVDVATGEAFWYFESDPEADTAIGGKDAAWPNGKNVTRSIPGTAAIVDVNMDGFADAVYVGDLEGRLWKIDVGIEFLDNKPWTEEVIYEDPDNFPIITKPATWMESLGTPPRVYFGTGGDDLAPAESVYSFIALIDDGETAEVEWYLGDPEVLGLPEAKQAGTLSAGEKVWADPKVANSIVFFSTLTGSIETVDPCESLVGVGSLYGRFVRQMGGTPVGSTAFSIAGENLESLNLEIKTRAAVTIGETEIVGGQRKRSVYIQEFDSTIQKLEQAVPSRLNIKSWREIYKIIK